MIELAGVSLVYQDHGKEVFACRDIALDVRPGEFLGILGPSGSGKSSLLYLMSGLKVPTHGEVRYAGQSFSARPLNQRDEIRLNEFGFVFQHPFLVGYLTALENVMLARPEGGDPEEAHARLEELGLAAKVHRRPHELSGGERQRVCVARALMGSPRVIFADEPTASLDHTNGLRVMEILAANRGEGSLVVVTHDRTMLESADRIVTIMDGQVAGITEQSPGDL